MTEVFIGALSTTRIDLNEEDREYYNDEKKKEIFEVRTCLDQLDLFSSNQPRDKMNMDLRQIWKALNFLAKIIGYEQEFQRIDKLHLPETVLLQDLFYVTDLFKHRTYKSYQVIDRWDGESDHYYILLQGVIEKELVRSSIFQYNYEQFLHKDMTISKSRKNLKKRFVRTDDQIPVCINSKRNQQRNTDNSSGLYRSITFTQTFQVNMATWKKYVSSFPALQQHHILNFIRKKLSINLKITEHKKNIVQQAKQAEEQIEEVKYPCLYSVQFYDKKRTFTLDSQAVYLVYEGEILVLSQNYKIQSSPGCVLNSQIYQLLGNKVSETVIYGSVTSKTECTIIKININVFNSYLDSNGDDLSTLSILLQNLQQSRREKIDINQIEKNCETLNFKTVRAQTNLKSTSHHDIKFKQPPMQLKDAISKLFNVTTKRTTFLPNCRGAKMKTQENERSHAKSREKVLQFKQIQSRIDKEERIAQIIRSEYSKKNRLTEPTSRPTLKPISKQELQQYQNYSILNSVLLKDTIACIQARNDLLKQTVVKQRKKREKQQNCDESQIKDKQKSAFRIFRDTSADIIKRKLKEIYQKTEEDQSDITPSKQNYSERQKQESAIMRRSQPTLIDRLTAKNKQNKHLWINYGQYMPKGRGVMRKMKKGQIRRVRLP